MEDSEDDTAPLDLVSGDTAVVKTRETDITHEPSRIPRAARESAMLVADEEPAMPGGAAEDDGAAADDGAVMSRPKKRAMYPRK